MTFGMRLRRLGIVLLAIGLLGMVRAEPPLQTKSKSAQVDQDPKGKVGKTPKGGKGSGSVQPIFIDPGGGGLGPCGADIYLPTGPITVPVGQVVNFEGGSNYGDVFIWAFGDGTSAGGDIVTHSYATTGTFTARLTARDSALEFTASSASVTVTVIASTPTVTVTPVTATVGPGLKQTFSASVTNLSSSAVTWSLPGGSTTGSITSAGVYTAPATLGTYTVRATSQVNTSIYGSATITVAAPTVFVKPSSVMILPGGTQVFSCIVSVLSNTAVTWSLPGGSATGTITSAGVYTAPATAGTYTVQALGSDGVTKGTATVFVNNPPVFSAGLTTQSLVQGKPFSLTLPVATDANLDAITYSVSGLPAGLSFTVSSRILAGTPTTAGTFTVTETATDTRGGSTSQSATYTVAANLVPVFSATVPTQDLVVGKPFSLTMPLATDGNGDAITYSVTGLPAGLTFTAAPPKISGKPTSLAGSTISNVVYKATDAKGAPKTQTISFRVAPNKPPVFSATSIPTLNVAVRQSFICQLPGATDGDQEPISYSFTNWATYATQLVGVSLNPSTLVLSGSIGTAGTYNLTYQALDPKGALATLTLTIVVTTANPVSFGASVFPNPTLKVGVAMANVVLPAATDTGVQTITYDVSGLPAGLSFNSGTRTISGTPVLAGTFAMTETATVPRGYQALLSGTWTVAPATYQAPIFQSTLPVAYSLKARTAFSEVWPSATDPNANNTSLTYAWAPASGSTLPPGLTFTASTHKVSGTPTTGGNFTVTYTVTDSFNQKASQTTTFVVEQTLPVISSFQATSTQISPNGTTTLSWSVSDATTVTLSPNPTNAPISASGGSLAVTPTASTAYVLTATNGAGSTSYMLIITVTGTTPLGIGSTASSLPVPSLSNFTKVNFEEALNYEWTDGTTPNRSNTGLITSVDVNRQLVTGLAGLTSASAKDLAIRSHYDYGYDRLGQLLRANGAFYNDLTTPTAAWTDLTSYTYDAHGNRDLHTPNGKGAWTYKYYQPGDVTPTVSSGNPGTNRLASATDGTTGGYQSFAYTLDGAVRSITKANGETQTLDYADPRFMRLPTHMERTTADGRKVLSDLIYDMSGTRIYKRDQVNQTGAPTPLISDRTTYYLANGTEVLMEVETKGSTGILAPDRYTAYIFGAGSRLARLSWDNDGRELPMDGNLLPNGDFEAGSTAWSPSGASTTTAMDSGLSSKVLQIKRTVAANQPAFVEQSFGTFGVGQILELSCQMKGPAMIGLFQAGAGQAARSGTGALRIGRDSGNWSQVLRYVGPVIPGGTVSATVQVWAASGTKAGLSLNNGTTFYSKYITGNGSWQTLTTSFTNATSADLKAWVYLIGDRDSASTDPRVVFDDLTVMGLSTGGFSEGFEDAPRLVTTATDGWYPQGQQLEWLKGGDAWQLAPWNTTSWGTQRLRRTLKQAGEIKVRLLSSSLDLSTVTSFDTVKVATKLQSTLATGRANYWPDPGFEGVVQPDSLVSRTASPDAKWPYLDYDGSNREGLKVMKVPAGAKYRRTVMGLTIGKNHLFSVWKKPAGGTWVREIRTVTPTIIGSVTIELPSTPETQIYLFDQAELVEWKTGDPTPEAWIPENRLGRVDWFITDHLGSTKLLIDQNGTHKFTGDDDPFGINLRSFGDKDSHRYTGQILDEEQGVYYYGARYYLPEIGRFLSGDPVKDVFDTPYSYVGNSPTMRTDSTGMFPDVLLDVAFIGADIASWARNMWKGNYDAATHDGVALAIDFGLVFVPGATGGGKAYKAALAAEGAGLKFVAAGTKRTAQAQVKAAQVQKIAKQPSIETLRRKAVDQAWAQEGKLIKGGEKGTREGGWTPAQQRELLETGRVKGMQGHHRNNVKHHPEDAGNPNNIEFLTPKEHFEAHGFNWKRETTGIPLDRSLK